MKQKNNPLLQILSLLLCLSLLLGMAPAIQLFTPAMAAEPEGTAHVCETHTHEGATTLGTAEGVTPVDAATLVAGGNFILNGDISLSGTVELTTGVSLHICLNGHTITSQKTMFVLKHNTIKNYLTICDCSEEKTGTLDATEQTAASNGAGIICVHNNGTLNLYGCKLTGSNGKASGGGGVRVDGSNATFNMYGGTITENATMTSNIAFKGGGVLVNRGTFNMYGGTITGNTGGKGNDVYVGGNATAANINIFGDAVIGELYVDTSKAAPTVSISKLASGASITSLTSLEGTATTDSTVQETQITGGYQYTFNDPHPDWTKIDGTTENVEALLAAGGSFMLTGDIAFSKHVTLAADLDICLNGYTISGHTTLFNLDKGYHTLTIDDCSKGEPGKLLVTEQTAVVSGAGIVRINEGTFNLYNGTLTGSNGKASGGGGVRVDGSNATFNMYGGTITENATMTSNIAYKGGGVLVRRGTFNMYGGTITNNTAAEGNGVAVGGDKNVAAVFNISGDAVVDDIYVNTSGLTPTLTVGELVPGASITSSAALTVRDDTVKVSQDSGNYLYEFETALFKDWLLFTEDFEEYTAGTDAFYTSAADDAGAAYPYWGGLNHGTLGSASYAQYDVAKDGENQYLKMTSVLGTKNNLVTKKAISGPYKLKMDFLFASGETSVPVMAVTLTQGSTLGGEIMAYLTPGENGARIYNSRDGVNQYPKNGDNNLTLAYDTWYTMEYSLELGSLSLAIWQTGNESTKYTCTLASAHLNAAILSSANNVRIDNVGKNIRTDILCLDNFSLTKAVALNMQDFATVEPGQTLNNLPTGDATNQLPAPTYSYTLEDPEFGYINNRGKLVAGYANSDDASVSEGETKLTLTLLDMRGQETDITFETTLVVGTANGVSIGDDIQVPEADIGKTHTLTATVDPAIVAVYGDNIKWKSSNESVATVDNGTLTYKGAGSAKITAVVLDATGMETKYFGSIQLQVGAKVLKVLGIGNSFTTDTMTYLSQLAYAADARIEVGYLFRNNGNIRQHAYNLAFNVNDYDWYTSNANNGKVTFINSGANLADKVESQNWDVIVLNHGVPYAGFANTYNADLEYLIDYLEDVQPDAKIYWNMTWSLEDGFTGSGSIPADYNEYFGSDQKVMYNAIVRCLDEMIVGEDAAFSSTNANNLGTGLGWGFDGCFFTGTAVQNLRQTVDHDRDLTRDGYHLSYDLGRMVVGMNTLKTLYDDLALGGTGVKLDLATAITAQEVAAMIELSDSTEYKYSEADLPKIIAAATAAAQVEGVPAQLEVKTPVKPEDVDDEVQTSIQVQAPQLQMFPDIKALADGTMLSVVLEYPEHSPITNTSDPYAALAQGSARIVMYESADGGHTWMTGTPVLIIDEMQLQQWGIVETYDRYSRIGACSSENYHAMADLRDPNLGTAYVDFDGDGDKEQVVIVTTWINFYGATSAVYQTRILLMLTGVRNDDGTYTWAAPKQIQSMMKRGDITSFSDGSILVPVIGSSGGVIPMQWNVTTKSWDEGAFVAMPHEDPSKYHTEISVVAPDPDGQTVYAFCRPDGAVLKSMDRGLTWELIGDESGSIDQPGFTILDENRVFVTWAIGVTTRNIQGKVFYFNADWSDTLTQQIYASSNRYAGNDTGDPSCALNAQGEVVVVSYEKAYRSIHFSIVDPEDPKWLPIELSDADKAVLYEEDADNALSSENVIPNTVAPVGAYTIEATVEFKSASDKAIFATGAGAVTVTPEGLALNTPTYILISVVGNQNFVKVWQAEEPKDWRIQSDAATAAQKPSVTGSGAILTDVAVTTKLIAQLQERLDVTIGDADMRLTYQIQPAYASYTFASSNEAVATVDASGLVHFIAEGTTTVTMTVNGSLELCCEVTVKGLPAELTGEGQSSVILEDDFESYTHGTNALWNDYWANKANSKYNFEEKANMNASSNGETRYDITKDTATGNQYLEINGRTSWFMSEAAITGNYTTQFDIFFVADGVTLNLTPWQNDPLVEGNEVHAFVNLKSNEVRFQICPEKLTVYDKGTTENPYLNYIGNSEQSTKFNPTAGTSGTWQTVKLVRIDGGMYLKVWKTYDESGNRNPEPAEWTITLTHGVLDTDMDSHVRFQYAGGATGASAYIDNLTISQQTFDVTYDVDGEKETESVIANSLLTAPADPAKEGYLFAGWYNGDKKWDFALDTMEKDVTLTAKWVVNKQYTVSFDSGVAAQTVEYGAKATKPADPTKEGFVFAGWYNGDKLWNFDLDAVEQNVTLTAKWEAITDDEGGSGEGGSNEGGSNEGGSNEGGSNEGDSNEGGSNEGGSGEGGSDEGGSNQGGNSGEDDPSKTGDNTLMPSFLLLATLSITALAVIILGKKKLF